MALLIHQGLELLGNDDGVGASVACPAPNRQGLLARDLRRKLATSPGINRAASPSPRTRYGLRRLIFTEDEEHRSPARSFVRVADANSRIGAATWQMFMN